MTLLDFLKGVLGQADDNEGTSEILGGFSELYESRPRLGREVLTLDQLPADQQERYTALEEEIRTMDTFFHSVDAFIPKIDGALRKREEEILVEAGLEGRFAYQSGQVQILGFGSDVWSYALPSGTVVVGFENGLDGVDAIMRRIHDELTGETAALGDWRQEVLQQFEAYNQLLVPFVVEYAKITPLGEHNLNYDLALVLCTGKTHSHSTDINLVTGQIEDDQEVAWKKDEVLRDKFRAEFENNHAECAHDTYILSHPSEHVAACHLAVLSPKILENYIVSLTMH